jgi:phospho-N-acetylmuramoyl-pentapeptide-transferase
VIALLMSASIAFAVSILVTPWVIHKFREHDIGQFIQEEVEGHLHKQGTPTMGGVVMIAAVLIAYFASHVRVWDPDGPHLSFTSLSSGGMLAILALVGMGVIGLADDYLKVSRRRSLGLSIAAKFGGQIIVAGAFAWGATAAGVSTELSFTRPLGIHLGVFFVVVVLVMLSGTANAVNLADGMDGLAGGSAALVFGAFVLIGYWKFRHPEFYSGVAYSLELAVVAAAMLGATLGFLWWNAAPARIFMGDVGSQALGGLMAALAILTNTQLLLILLGGLYVAETVSVILQVASFRLLGRRVFRMAPFHYHFDLGGWPETTVVVRFWIIAGLCVALALAVFYGDFVNSGLRDIPGVS